MLKIGILSGSKLSIPSIGYLLQNGIALEILLPGRINEDQAELEYYLAQCGMPYHKWNKQQVNQQLASWAINAQVNFIWVLTFPYIISKEAINYLSVPIFNFHFAPLPKYRGAQPVFWMIKNQEKKGGISIHELTKKIDAGPIHHFEPYKIHDQETFGSYMYNISQLNIQAIHNFLLPQIKGERKQSIKAQNEAASNYYQKPTSSDVQISWNSMTAEQIEALCRACNPWNKGAITTLEGKAFRVIEVEIINDVIHEQEKAGSIIYKRNGEQFLVSTSDSKYLELKVIATEEGIYGSDRLNQPISKSAKFFQ